MKMCELASEGNLVCVTLSAVEDIFLKKNLIWSSPGPPLFYLQAKSDNCSFPSADVHLIFKAASSPSSQSSSPLSLFSAFVFLDLI